MYKWSIAILLMLASSVVARELPSEADLRAAYCIPLVQDFLNSLRSVNTHAQSPALSPELQAMRDQSDAAFAEIVSEFDDNLRRLRLYLIPRIPYLDLRGLEAARKRGEEDAARFEQYQKTCRVKCEHLKRKSSWPGCLDKCHADNPLNPRIKPCSELNWLPF
jgi:hypothetical protein